MSILAALRLSRAPVGGLVATGLFYGCFAAYVPVLKEMLGLNDAEFGLVLLGTATGLATAMWMAPSIDRRLGRGTMPLAASALAVFFLLPPLTATPWLFVAALFGIGFAAGLLDIVANARVSELEAAHGRPLMSANHAMFSATYAAAALLAGVAREAGAPPPLVFAGFSVLMLGCVPSSFASGSAAATRDRTTGAEARLIWPVLLCGLVVLIAFLAEATVETWSALYVERTLGGSATEGALGPTVLGLTMAVGRFGGQVTAERLREVSIIAWAALLSTAGALLTASAPTPAWAYVGFALLGLGISVIGPMGLSLVGKLVAPQFRTKAISRAAIVGFSVYFLAPVLIGTISQVAGLRTVFAFLAVVLLCLVPLSLILGRLRMRMAAG